jgi:hypothetical protein
MTTPPRSDDARRCIKCGREVGPDETICELCNRAGMATPSASQYHGTVVAAILLAVVGLAVAASLSMRGVGPYSADIRSVDPADLGYTITYVVRNEGTKAGRAKCLLVALGETGQQIRSRNTVTDQIPGGESGEQRETIAGLETEPASVSVTCS